jgi:hypothetical protein
VKRGNKGKSEKGEGKKTSGSLPTACREYRGTSKWAFKIMAIIVRTELRILRFL